MDDVTYHLSQDVWVYLPVKNWSRLWNYHQSDITCYDVLRSAGIVLFEKRKKFQNKPFYFNWWYASRSPCICTIRLSLEQTSTTFFHALNAVYEGWSGSSRTFILAQRIFARKLTQFVGINIDYWCICMQKLNLIPQTTKELQRF